MAKALGHPARVAIMDYLSSLDSCFFGDIHSVLPISKATVSQHLKELKAAGLIQGEIEAPKVRYCINRKTGSLPENSSPIFSAGKAGADAANRRSLARAYFARAFCGEKGPKGGAHLGIGACGFFAGGLQDSPPDCLQIFWFLF